MSSVPIWLIALVCAAVAPWAVRVLERAMLRRVRERTDALLARAEADARAGAPRDAGADAGEPADAGVASRPNDAGVARPGGHT
jgi:hypothetical protein